MNITKMKKTTKIIDIILKIFQIICLVGAIVALVAIFPIALAKDTGIFEIADTLDLGSISLSVANIQNYVDASVMKTSIVLNLIIAIAVLVVVFFGIKLFRSILAPMKDGRSFENGIAKKIRKLAVYVLVGGFLIQVSEVVERVTGLASVDIPALTEGTEIVRVTSVNNISVGFILMALIVFLLSYIFQYGEILQKESDETL